jgi:hypothetical protein
MATDRIGSWLGLGNGRMFWPLDPRATEVHIDDIAHALSNTCRWGGRVSDWYSVAQHSVHVAQIVERTNPQLALHALLHDAAEAYLGDIPTPIKRHLDVHRHGSHEPFFDTEWRVLDAIGEAFGLGRFVEMKVIHDADAIALATEARDLMGGLTWDGMVPTNEPVLEPLSPRAARTQFMAMFRRLAAVETVGEKTS